MRPASGCLSGILPTRDVLLPSRTSFFRDRWLPRIHQFTKRAAKVGKKSLLPKQLRFFTLFGSVLRENDRPKP